MSQPAIDPIRQANGRYYAEVVVNGKRKLVKDYSSYEACYLAASDWAQKRLKRK